MPDSWVVCILDSSFYVLEKLSFSICLNDLLFGSFQLCRREVKKVCRNLRYLYGCVPFDNMVDLRIYLAILVMSHALDEGREDVELIDLMSFWG